MASGHLLLSCAKRAATTKIDLFAYLWQLPCALCSLNLNDIACQVDKARNNNYAEDSITCRILCVIILLKLR